jgi:hypothetical protein
MKIPPEPEDAKLNQEKEADKHEDGKKNEEREQGKG